MKYAKMFLQTLEVFHNTHVLIVVKNRTHALNLEARHMVVHTGEKKCDVCAKGFTENGSLEKHRKIHLEEKPFGCNICKKCFRDQEP